MATLLIKQDDISKNTPIGGNVQTTRIIPAIKSAQITKIKPLLGRNLYKKIVKDFEDDTLVDQYLELYEDYIVPMLIHVSASHYFSYGAYNISDKGIYKAVGSDSEGVSKNEVDYLVKAQEGLYEDFKTGFYSFMDFNYKIFPEWERVTTRTKSFGGWTLGDSKISNRNSASSATPTPITTTWGSIGGILNNQLDLRDALNLKANALDVSLVGFSGDYNDLLNIPAPGNIEWGNIGGTLTTQTDLIDALDLKANALDVSLVGFSGEYSDILNLPTIPLLEWGNIGGTLTTQTDLVDALDLKANVLDISLVGFSGEYSDLLNVPTPGNIEWGNIGGTLTTQTDLVDALDLKANTSDLATVATTGSYDDLINIPTPLVLDWGNIGGTLSTQTDLIDALDLKANSLDISLVGFSGEYSDILNLPTIPVLNWGNIGGTLSNQTDLTNVLDLKANTSDLATVATTGSYDDLINIPTPLVLEWGNINGTLSNQTDLTNVLDLKANTSDLATVATTGSYDDLINIPTPLVLEWGNIGGTLSTQTDLTNVLDLKANTSDLATVATTGEYSDILNLPSIVNSLNGNTGIITINTGNIPQSTGFRFLTDQQKVDATRLSTTTQNGLLAGSDFNTFNNKQAELVSGTNIKTISGVNLLGSGDVVLTKANVGLGNVDNTSDVNKPISNATQIDLDSKVESITAGEPTGSDRLSNMVSLTQAEYNSGTKVADTFYIITDA
jgi:hypothetical protein